MTQKLAETNLINYTRMGSSKHRQLDGLTQGNEPEQATRKARETNGPVFPRFVLSPLFPPKCPHISPTVLLGLDLLLSGVGEVRVKPSELGAGFGCPTTFAPTIPLGPDTLGRAS